MKTYDTIIIGAGHNGLVAASYLAKQGKKVLVLERRDIIGGQVVTESFGDGFTVDSLYAGGSLRPDIVKHLNLASHGLVVDSVRKPFISLQADSKHLVDSGIMSGADVVAAIALGATSTLVGRAYLFGLMAGGQAGVERVTDILTGEVRRTMALLGAATVADLNPGHVRLAP